MDFKRKQRFSIRKFTFGAASVLLGVAIVPTAVSADTDATNSSSVQLTSNSSATGQSSSSAASSNAENSAASTSAGSSAVSTNAGSSAASTSAGSSAASSNAETPVVSSADNDATSSTASVDKSDLQYAVTTLKNRLKQVHPSQDVAIKGQAALAATEAVLANESATAEQVATAEVSVEAAKTDIQDFLRELAQKGIYDARTYAKKSETTATEDKTSSDTTKKTEESTPATSEETVATDTHKVVYQFVSGTEGKKLPQEVTDLTPASTDEEVSEPEAPSTTEYTEEKNGTWTFKGYEKIVKDAQTIYQGTWIFRATNALKRPENEGAPMPEGTQFRADTVVLAAPTIVTDMSSSARSYRDMVVNAPGATTVTVKKGEEVVATATVTDGVATIAAPTNVGNITTDKTNISLTADAGGWPPGLLTVEASNGQDTQSTTVQVNFPLARTDLEYTFNPVETTREDNLDSISSLDATEKASLKPLGVLQWADPTTKDTLVYFYNVSDTGSLKATEVLNSITATTIESTTGRNLTVEGTDKKKAEDTIAPLAASAYIYYREDNGTYYRTLILDLLKGRYGNQPVTLLSNKSTAIAEDGLSLSESENYGYATTITYTGTDSITGETKSKLFNNKDSQILVVTPSSFTIASAEGSPRNNTTVSDNGTTANNRIGVYFVPVDVTAPEITSSSVTQQSGTKTKEELATLAGNPGFTATDNWSTDDNITKTVYFYDASDNKVDVTALSGGSTYTLKATAIDQAGNASQVDMGSVTVELTAPVLEGPTLVNRAGFKNVPIYVTAAEGATVELFSVQSGVRVSMGSNVKSTSAVDSNGNVVVELLPVDSSGDLLPLPEGEVVAVQTKNGMTSADSNAKTVTANNINTNYTVAAKTQTVTETGDKTANAGAAVTGRDTDPGFRITDKGIVYYFDVNNSTAFTSDDLLKALTATPKDSTSGLRTLDGGDKFKTGTNNENDGTDGFSTKALVYYNTVAEGVRPTNILDIVNAQSGWGTRQIVGGSNNYVPAKPTTDDETAVVDAYTITEDNNNGLGEFSITYKETDSITGESTSKIVAGQESEIQVASDQTRDTGRLQLYSTAVSVASSNSAYTQDLRKTGTGMLNFFVVPVDVTAPEIASSSVTQQSGTKTKSELATLAENPGFTATDNWSTAANVTKTVYFYEGTTKVAVADLVAGTTYTLKATAIDQAGNASQADMGSVTVAGTPTAVDKAITVTRGESVNLEETSIFTAGASTTLSSIALASGSDAQGLSFTANSDKTGVTFTGTTTATTDYSFKLVVTDSVGQTAEATITVTVQTQADKYAASRNEATETTLDYGSTAEASSFVTISPTPATAPKITWKTEPDTSSPGSQTAVALVTYEDGSTETVEVPITVKPNYQPAIDEINQKLAAETEKVNALTNLSDDEKTAAITALTDAANSAITAVKAKTTQDEVNTAGTEGAATVTANPYVELNTARTNAITDVETAATDKISEINNRTDLTDEETAAAIEEVNTAKEAAVTAIKEATTVDAVNTTKTSEVEKITAINPTAEKKTAAKAAIDAAATAEKAKIDALSNLTDEEKAAAKAELDKVATAEKAKVDAATTTTNAAVDAAETAGIAALAAKELEAEKQDAKNAIDAAAVVEKAKIDNLSNLTDAEKTAAKAELDKVATAEKAKVDQAADSAAVDAAETAGIEALATKELEAEKQDAKNAIDSAVETKKAEIAADTTATAEEKAKAIAEVETAAATAKEAIDDAPSATEVTAAKEAGEKAISDIVASSKKADAIAEIEKAAEVRKAEIATSETATAEEKAKAIAEVEKAAEAAKDAIKAATTDTAVDTAVTDGKTAINAVTPEATKKADAIAEVEKAAEAKKAAINNDATATAEEKAAAIKEVEDAVEAAKDAINAATTDAEVDTAKDTGTDAIADVVPSSKKADAIAEVEKAAEAKKEAINADTTTTAEEKAKAIAEVEKATEAAKEAIIDATTDTAVDTAVTDGKTAINAVTPEATKKADAIAEVEKATEAKKAAINNDATATAEEKEKAIAEVEKAAQAAKDAINAATTDAAVDTAKDTGTDAIADVVPSSKKADAIAEVEKAAEAKKAAINADTTTTAEEKAKAIAEVEKAAEAAKEAIIDATTDTAVDTAVTDGKTAIDAVTPEATKKADAIAEVEKAAEAKKAAINNDATATAEEKAAAIAEVEKAAQAAKDAINAATTDATVDTAKDAGIKAIEEISASPKKAKAKSDIDAAAKAAKEAIDADTTTTDAEKAAAKAAIDEVAAAAKKAIDDATSDAAVDTAVTDGKTAISAVAIPTKPALTPVADPSALTAAEKVKVREAVKAANPTLSGSQISVADDGTVTVTREDGTTLVLSPSSTVKKADNLIYTPVSKIAVTDSADLTDLAKVKAALEAVNTHLPEGTVVTVDEDGVTFTYPDGTKTFLPIYATVDPATTPALPEYDLSSLVALQEEIAKQTDVTSSTDYTNADADKKQAYDDALATAEKVFADPASFTAEEITAAKAALEAARVALNGEEKQRIKLLEVDKSKLQVAVDAASKVKDLVTYKLATGSLKEAYDLALLAAQAVLANPNATQAEIDEALANLLAAEAALNGKEQDSIVVPTPAPAPASHKRPAYSNAKDNARKLPKTGEEASLASMLLATLTGSLAFGLAKKKRKDEE